VPLLFVIVPVTQSNALPNVQLPPTPSKVTPPVSVFPLVVIVFPVAVEAKVVKPVYVLVKFVAGNERLPYTVNPTPEPARVIVASVLIVISLQTLGVFAIVMVNVVVPMFELASKNTLSEAVGTDAPIVAALMLEDAIVPLALVTHEFPLPLTIVPLAVPELVNKVIPATRAGLPVVVKAVPVRLPVKDTPEAADHFVVPEEFQVPDPPTQYLSAMFIP